MLDISRETKQWIRDQGVAIVVLCAVLYGAYELFKEQRESHERSVAAIAIAMGNLADSYSAIDKRVEVISVDLEILNGRSQRTLREVRTLDTVVTQ